MFKSGRRAALAGGPDVWEIASALRRISAPTLVVWGSEDKLTPVQYADDFARLIPKARVEVLDGAAHMAPSQRQHDFVKLRDSFLA